MGNGPFASLEENEKLRRLYTENIEKEIDKIILSSKDYKIENKTEINIKRFIEIFIADLILEMNKKFPETNYSVYINYRIKSSKSAISKLENYMQRMQIGERISIKAITDLIGMRMIITKIPYAVILGKEEKNNLTIQSLIEERSKNQKFSREFEKVRSELLEEENYNEVAYYSQCRDLIYNILQTIHTSQPGKENYAIELRNTYKELLRFCEEKISFDQIMGETDKTISLKEISEDTGSRKINFIQLLDDFNERINSKLALRLYSDYMPKLFEDSENLKALGASLSKNENRTKKKREESGFVADFYGINFEGIPLPTEFQIMYVDEHVASSIGYSAHSKLMGKENKPVELPPVYNKRKLEEVNNIARSKNMKQEQWYILQRIMQVKELSIEQMQFLNDMVEKRMKQEQIILTQEEQEMLQNICNLSKEENEKLEEIFLKEGCKIFSNWAESVSPINGTAKLDLDSFAKNRVKFEYDDPYESLSHILRQQTEGYNLDASYAEMVEDFLGRVYKNRREWLGKDNEIEATSSVLDFEIEEYIRDFLPELKRKCKKEVKEEER